MAELAASDTSASEPVSTALSGPAPSEAAPSALTPWKTLLGIVIRPLQTFESLREARSGYWWLVLAVTFVAILLLAVASSAVTARAFQNFTPPAGAVTTGGTGATAQQFQRTSSVLLILLAVLGGLFMTGLDYGLRALVSFASGMVLGGHMTFRQAFRMSLWTTIPFVVRRFVQTIAVALTGGQVAAGLSAALTTAEIRALPLLNTIFTNLDFYALWSAILFGIGTAITGRLSKGKGLVAMGVYLGLSLAGILIVYAISSALGSLFGGSGRTGGNFGGGRGGVRIPGG